LQAEVILPGDFACSAKTVWFTCCKIRRSLHRQARYAIDALLGSNHFCAPLWALPPVNPATF
jgi:hypothetical protein